MIESSRDRMLFEKDSSRFFLSDRDRPSGLPGRSRV
jgi:hypothetical protein